MMAVTSMSTSPATRRLLVVDDDPVALKICETSFKKVGYEVIQAGSAAAARRHLEEFGVESFSAVISDLRMPGEDGLSLIHHLHTLDAAISAVLMTAEGDKALVTRALREGAQNFVDKPLTPPALVAAAATAVAATTKNRRLASEASSARAMAETQLLLLGRQTSKLAGRLKLSFHPHATAGGDFAAAYELDEHRFVILVTDVSGHDLRAAYHSAYLQGLARGLLVNGEDLAVVFAHLNRLLLEEWNGDGQINLSLAACAVCVDLARHQVQVLNCGLPSPSLTSRDGMAELAGATGSSPLGWFDDLPPVVIRDFNQGLLQFWSDGLEDLAERHGVSTLALAYRLHQSTSRDEGVLKLSADDVIATRLDLSDHPGRDTRYPLLTECYAASSQERIDALQDYFERSLRMALPHLGEDTLVNTLLCLREGLLNALTHGCKRPDIDRATLQVAYAPETESLHVCIADSGPGHNFDYLHHEERAARELVTEHRGLIMMKHLSRNLQVSTGGSRVTMEFPLTTT